MMIEKDSIANRNTFIRITKEFNFEMAHALYEYDGPCKNIHGHSYQLSVTVKGLVNNESNNPKQGMVMDFSTLKNIVKTAVIEPLDHALVLSEKSIEQLPILDDALFGKVVRVNYQPTCENIIVDLAAKIASGLPPNVVLHHLLLRETSTSFAEWYAADNV